MSRIVTGYIGPIHACDVRWGRVFGDGSAKGVDRDVQADVTHPITQAMIEQLPKLTDKALADLRKHTASPLRQELGSVSKPEDVATWLRMIDAEMAYRQREKRGIVSRVFAALTGGK